MKSLSKHTYVVTCLPAFARAFSTISLSRLAFPYMFARVRAGFLLDMSDKNKEKQAYEFSAFDFCARYPYLEGSIIEVIAGLKTYSDPFTLLFWVRELLKKQIDLNRRVLPDFNDNYDFELSVMQKEHPLLKHYLDFAGATDAKRARDTLNKVNEEIAALLERDLTDEEKSL